MSHSEKDPEAERRHEAHAAIEEDHKILRELLGRIEGSADLCQLQGLMAELKPLLVEHFEREDADTGFPDIVRSNAPDRMAVVEELAGEHDEILAMIEGLEGRIRELLEGPAAQLFREGVELAEKLRRHESRETDLLLDVMYTDMGTKD
jgi:hypothetical protein